MINYIVLRYINLARSTTKTPRILSKQNLSSSDPHLLDINKIEKPILTTDENTTVKKCPLLLSFAQLHQARQFLKLAEAYQTDCSKYSFLIIQLKKIIFFCIYLVVVLCLQDPIHHREVKYQQLSTIRHDMHQELENYVVLHVNHKNKYILFENLFL